MVWYKYLYADERISRKKEKIKWKVCHNAGQINLYLVTLSRGPGKLLEIVSTLTLMQRAYPKEGLFVVGLARGYEQAVCLATQIILEVYQETGGFDVKSDLLNKHRARKAQVGL